MRVCVTGASGFIGKELCKYLVKKNFQVLATVRDLNNTQFKCNKNLEIVELVNIDGKTDWTKILNDVDCVIHCASKTNNTIRNKGDKLIDYKSVNIDGTKTLLDQAHKLGVKRLIFLSSIRVNGASTKKNQKFTNEDIPSPIDNYAISKYEAEKILLKKSLLLGIEIVIIRAPLVYGPEVKGNFLNLLGLTYSHVPLPFKSINNIRSFVGLDNLVNLISCCIVHSEASGKIFLVSDDDDISTPEFIKKIASKMNKNKILLPVPVAILKFIGLIFGKFNQIKKLTSSLQIDINFTKKTLNWKPPISIDEGLSKTIKWYLRKL